ncbi:MAG: glycosyl transferase [marine bacterium B5-7]|nr:MAG: glycosyl transferase [marine bacterium B5-7]
MEHTRVEKMAPETSSAIANEQIAIVIPAKNEAEPLAQLLVELRRLLTGSEIVVVNDGSTDQTLEVAKEHADVVVNHPISLGNGAAVKAGARAASREILVFMDGDGQHKATDVLRLVEALTDGSYMVVGARDKSSHANIFRKVANGLYNHLASYMTGQRIEDLTSGFRAVKKKYFDMFVNLLPNGFSYPTTITMAFFRSGFPVTYVPIHAEMRTGKSHVKPLRDGSKFLLIIFRIGSLYSPLKIFVPVSLVMFLIASAYYGYTYVTTSRFTNMSALFYMTSVLTFFIGLVSEQVTQLLYLSNTLKKD